MENKNNEVLQDASGKSENEMPLQFLQVFRIQKVSICEKFLIQSWTHLGKLLIRIPEFWN